MKKRWSMMLILLLFFIFSTISNVSAHPTSAAFTMLDIGAKKTTLSYQIDALSVIEGVGGDTNEDDLLSDEEIKALGFRLTEWIEHSIVIEKDGKEQEGELLSVKPENSRDRDLITLKFNYPGFQYGEVISFLDGIFASSVTTHPYTNFLYATFDGQASQAALQGENRTWTMLLSPTQQEQGSGDQTTTSTKKPEQESGADWFSFFKLGMHHILSGYEHLLFLFVLIIGRQKWKQSIVLVTAFTVAHSFTMTLVALETFTLPPSIMESMIAVSIGYVALENIFRKEIKHRWVITFLFGLVHGLAFADTLSGMNISSSEIAVALIGFACGLEVIQLSIVFLAIPVLFWMEKKWGFVAPVKRKKGKDAQSVAKSAEISTLSKLTAHFKRNGIYQNSAFQVGINYASVVAFGFAVMWFIERVFL